MNGLNPAIPQCPRIMLSEAMIACLRAEIERTGVGPHVLSARSFEA
jgi:hypothetical protein